MMMPTCPTLTTERLTLRGPALRDFEPVAAFMADPVRSPGFGGPDTRDNAWRWWASMIGHWCIHGYGFFTVETKAGEAVGIVGLWNPEGWPEPELGWVMFENGEGHGYAYEAAKAVRDYAYSTLGMTTLTSNILPTNTRSQALARKLGAVYERTYENPNMGTDDLWRHPGPDQVAGAVA
jgi:RimJ/RimL family protein N-acetyltransferase